MTSRSGCSHLRHGVISHRSCGSINDDDAEINNNDDDDDDDNDDDDNHDDREEYCNVDDHYSDDEMIALEESIEQDFSKDLSLGQRNNHPPHRLSI